MSLFRASKTTQKETATKMASNVFANMLFPGEIIEHALQGKGAAKNLLLSVGVLALTDKRVLYYSQDGSLTEKEIILYNKIISVSAIGGFEPKMGNYTGIAVELANGKTRVVRCLNNDENNALVNVMLMAIEQRR